MTNIIRKKVIVHIEDEYQDWGNLIRAVENSIGQGIVDEREFDGMRSVPPDGKTDSYAVTHIFWTQNKQRYSVYWVAVREAKLNEEIRSLDLWSGVSPADTFFVVDGLRENSNGKGSYPSVGESLSDIVDLIEDTYKQVRVFTAYKEDFEAGKYPVEIMIKSKGGKIAKSNIADHPELMLSKSMRKSLKIELGEFIRQFLMQDDKISDG